MSKPDPGKTEVPADPTACDALAAKLLTAQRMVASLNTGSEVRRRLNLRFMAICTALKMRGASAARCSARLDRLMADAEEARAGSADEV